jgi:hypothetical protein
MHPKIVANHSSPFKVAGVRDLLERIAALESVARVIPGRMRRVGGNATLRLVDSGMAAGQSGRKYTILAQGTSIELFVVPVDGRLTELESAMAMQPEYAAVGNVRRAQEAAVAAERAERLAEARRHHGPRPRPASDKG